jgi:hypothetical protein
MPQEYPTGDTVHTQPTQESELDCLNYFTAVENRSEMRGDSDAPRLHRGTVRVRVEKYRFL